MERATVERRIETYVRLWRTPGTGLLAELFTIEASYQPSPWAPPLVGLDEIARFWESERDGADEEFSLSVLHVRGVAVRTEPTGWSLAGSASGPGTILAP